jgi:hypothetical protein
MPRFSPPLIGVGFALVVALAFPSSKTRADDPLDLSRDSVLPLTLDFGVLTTDTSPTTARPNQIRLFRITPGFLSDPVGLEDDPAPLGADGLPIKADDGPNWVEVAIGNDNPFFDVRLPGDPGGIGYTRVHSQVQVLDLPSTSCAIGVQAVTPAGAQQGGIEDGPTVISPGFSMFHSLQDGTAFQGFVSKDLHVASPANLTDTLSHPGQLDRSVQYGMAVQRPLLPQDDSIFLFVEALGRYHYDSTTSATTASAPTMEVLPGMHVKMSDGWWLSGGVILPVNQNRPVDAHLWQITCSFQF